MKNILVFFGGVSQEHDISIITGVLTLNSIDKTKFNPIPIYVHSNGLWYSGEILKNLSFYKEFKEKDVMRVALVAGENVLYKIKKNKLKALFAVSGAINCMHGRNGEDGSLCGVLQLSKIPLASPNAFSSALAIDKSITKLCLKAVGVNFVPSVTVSRKSYFKNKSSETAKITGALDYPIIVKPSTSGSSIGIGVANSYIELESALLEAFKFDDEVICEKYLKGAIDINCAAYKLGDEIKISELEKPVTANDILTFNDKYLGSKTGSGREFPADVPRSISDEIKDITKKVYSSFGFSGIVRIDYLLFEGQVYLNEINSVPGSMAYYLFCNKISEFTELLTDLLNESFVNYLSKASLRYEFKSGVLNGEGLGYKK